MEQFAQKLITTTTLGEQISIGEYNGHNTNAKPGEYKVYEITNEGDIYAILFVHVDQTTITNFCDTRHYLVICYGLFGGPETAGFGFGLGVERLLLVLEKQGVALPIENALDIYIAVLGEGANLKALELVQALRQQGFKAERDYLNRKLKAQFKSADVFGAKTLITLGETEVESGQVTVKNNQTREELEVSLDAICQNFSEVFEKLYLGQ
jgi:histidine--tRNA ligase